MMRDRAMDRIRSAFVWFAVVGALGLVGACVGGESDQRVSAARLTAAQRVGSRAPSLPVFVVRLAQGDIAEGASQRSTVDELAAEAEEVSRPIDEARVLFLEVLAESAEEGRVRADVVATVADRVVRATERAAPKLFLIVAELQRVLTKRQRETLVLLLAKSFDKWSPAWDATSPHPRPLSDASDRRWVMALSGDDLAFRAMGDEFARAMSARARDWTTHFPERVGAELANQSPSDRRVLILRLRSDDWAD
jgi:hypothetical protein